MSFYNHTPLKLLGDQCIKFTNLPPTSHCCGKGEINDFLFTTTREKPHCKRNTKDKVPKKFIKFNF